MDGDPICEEPQKKNNNSWFHGLYQKKNSCHTNFLGSMDGVFTYVKTIRIYKNQPFM